MGNRGKKAGRYLKKRNKNNLPILDSDQDFLSVFEKKESGQDQQEKIESESKILDMQTNTADFAENEVKEDFAQLLEESFKNKNFKPVKKTNAMPLKKRLKRYPPVELVLDLHGYTAIGAQAKARSFIQNSKRQGFFTIKIIVGKGRHSDFGPVLPDVVEDVVKELKKQDLVLWSEWEKKTKTGSGALIVYLKQFERFE